MLVRSPTGSDLAGLMRLQGDDPATSAWGAVGYTKVPSHAQAPGYTVTCTEREGKYFATLSVTSDADEGVNASVYVRAGTYETNLGLSKKDYRELLPQIKEGTNHLTDCMALGDGRVFDNVRPNRVYLYLSDDIAAASKNAELEHCSDYVYAYEQSLELLETALKKVAGQPFGPADTQDAARGLAESAILTGVPVHLAPLGGDGGRWLSEYARLASRSADRDTRLYHNFGMEVMDQPPPGQITYLTPAGLRDPKNLERIFVRMTVGRTQIGVHPPSAIVV